MEVVPCLLTFLDWYCQYCHICILCLVRQIFLLQILRNSSRRHSVLMLLSLSSVTNLDGILAFVQHACCHTGAFRWSGGQP